MAQETNASWQPPRQNYNHLPLWTFLTWRIPSAVKSCRGISLPFISISFSSQLSSLIRNYTSLSGLQAFAPTTIGTLGNGSIPLEVLIDLRCESNDFERLVPQTEAIFHYDKFNRLRLRNNITSIATRTTAQSPTGINDSHLQDQTVGTSFVRFAPASYSTPIRI